MHWPDLESLKRADERFAGLVVARYMRATPKPNDVDGKQGAFDLLLQYDDGRVGALEVTSHAGRHMRATQAAIKAHGHRWPNPGRLNWIIQVADGTRVDHLRKSYERIIRECEAQGVTDPRLLASRSPEAQWLSSQQGTEMFGGPPVGGNSAVLVLPKGRAAFVDSELHGLSVALSDVLSAEGVRRRAEKVAALRGFDERHLFVTIGMGGLPDPIYIALMRPADVLPSQPPEGVPTGLSHLWFTTGWAGSALIRWNLESGWRAWRLPSEPF
jgi:hypothetical protein